MHASTQHNKAQLMIERAKKLIDDTDVFLKKSQEDYVAMQETISAEKKQHADAHKKADDAIRTGLANVTKAADEYFGAFDDTDPV